MEYHGDWGSLACIQNHYFGFQSVETQDHIVVVIGGPILMFGDKSRFLSTDDQNAGTLTIYERWKSGTINWEKDLSGPFVLLIINKDSHEITCVTDLMMFIPVYQNIKEKSLVLGTHVDCTARAASVQNDFDIISINDFILNDAVTYPYTVYTRIRQCRPATVHHYRLFQQKIISNQMSTYWLPLEKSSFKNIDEASFALRHALCGYIERATDSLDNIAHFISGGEDSRAITGMLPSHKKRNAFIFLESMNGEGKTARKISHIYGALFNVEFRSKTYYLDIFSQGVDLVGSGNQYLHLHIFGFVEKCRLINYPAVFGGYLSDSLIKAVYGRKAWFHKKLPFLPEYFIRAEKQTKLSEDYSIIDKEILQAITERRKEQMKRVQQLRPVTCHEWFVLWPATMRSSITNFSSTRRLFRSYEPFMSNEVVKISASVPINWKLNRRLFHKAMKPILKPSRWVIHNFDGRLPYFSWWFNIPIQFFIWLFRQILKRLGRKPQITWADWNSMGQSGKWKDLVKFYSEEFKKFKHHFGIKNDICPFHCDKLDMIIKINFMQILYIINKNEKTANK